MRATLVQISNGRELLASARARSTTKQQGHSAVLRDAVERYLARKHRRDVDRQIAMAYRGKSRDLLVDAEAWLEEQARPEQ